MTAHIRQLVKRLINVATLFEDQKRYADAEKLLLQALAIYRAALGENHLYVATTYNNLGSLYENAGDLARAETLLLAANQVTLQVFTSAMENDPRLSQAEAIRIAMAALASDQSIGFAAHPSTWAAFALVGDGGPK